MEKENKGNNNKYKLDTKTIIIIILCLIIIVGIVVFALKRGNNQTIAKNSNTAISKIEKDNTVENSNNERATNITNTDNANSTGNTTVNKIGNTTIPTINLNEPVSKENKYELNLKSSKFGKIINPPNTSGYYSYYEASDEHQYLEIVYDYKNLTGNGVRADRVTSIKIKCNNKYEYDGFSVIEDSDRDFTYSNITQIPALSTGKMHYLIEVPDEVANSDTPIVAIINCEKDTYQINLR